MHLLPTFCLRLGSSLQPAWQHTAVGLAAHYIRLGSTLQSAWQYTDIGLAVAWQQIFNVKQLPPA